VTLLPEPGDYMVPLPAQPAGVPWPGEMWPEGPVPTGVDLEPLLDAAFDPDGPLATTLAVVVVHNGRIVTERYAGGVAQWDGPDRQVEATTPLLSWSMAKSMLHAVVGMLMGDGLIELDEPAGISTWQEPGDPRAAVTLDHLLQMRDGLDFAEDYEDAGTSDVLEMLFGRGQDDVASFAADRPLIARPGERFNYSSGTTNIVSGVVAQLVGPGPAYERYLRDRLFDPIGAESARATFDAAGTWIASSYLHATARDFARFGLLYLRDGIWDGRRLLPEGWVDHGRLARSVDPTDGWLHGAHWWVAGDEHGTFWAAGYEGQSILVCPGLDLVLVRLGRTPEARSEQLREWRRDVVAAFAGAGDTAG
jgi:CubicO group peptidase (beta-lactamase class C family)